MAPCSEIGLEQHPALEWAIGENMESKTPVVVEDVSALVAARNDVIENTKVREYVHLNYAHALNEHFSFDWFDVENSAMVDHPALKAEKAALYEGLKGVGHTNPSQMWKRIRKYGREDRYGKDAESTGGDADGAGDGMETGDTSSTARPPMVRNVEELTALYKFNARQESLPDALFNAQQHIIKALECLGVDISGLGQ